MVQILSRFRQENDNKEDDDNSNEEAVDLKGEHARAVSILDVEANNYLVFHEDALKEILLRNDIQDLPLAVISVVGAFGKGKSFLQDFFIRFLRVLGAEGWEGNGDEPLVGFPWRNGSERHTVGIQVWSEVFKMRKSNGEEYGILLMDTQGQFDNKTTTNTNATIFALSTMISSVQIYNLHKNIQEDDLQHLGMFIEYGRVAMENYNCIPFQKLQLLVRDWGPQYDFGWGADGGDNLMRQRLMELPDQAEELISVRRHIRSCFKTITCFLMPHPGLEAEEKMDFDGRLNDMRPEFVNSLKQFVPLILDPENIVLKEVHGNNVKARELLNYFAAYTDVFQEGGMPNVMSMMQATTEVSISESVDAAMDLYVSKMGVVCGPNTAFLSSHDLLDAHNQAKDDALAHFDNRKKLGGVETLQVFRTRLDKKISKQLKAYVQLNESKDTGKLLQTTVKNTAARAVSAAGAIIKRTSKKAIAMMPILSNTEDTDATKLAGVALGVSLHVAGWIFLPYVMAGMYGTGIALGVGLEFGAYVHNKIKTKNQNRLIQSRT